MREEQKRKAAARRRRERARKQRNRRIVLTVALVLVVALASIGGTLAWLVDKTDSVVNTFTTSDVDIELTETWNAKSDPSKQENDIWQGKLVPGTDLTKDPKVTVKTGSEACWLFVKVEEKGWPTVQETDGTTLKVNYSIATGWTQGTGTGEGGNGVPTNVWYREVEASNADKVFEILTDNKVTVSSTLTKTEMNNITNNFTLTFTAYAIQKENISDVKTAWAQASSNT